MIEKIKRIIEKSEDQVLEFDDRYNANTKKKINNRKNNNDSKLFNLWVEENKAIIKKLAQNENRAKNMSYFDGLFETDKRIKEIRSLKKKNIKIIGTFCNFVPEELIYAAGAIPIRLCSGCHDAIGIAEETFPRDSCPLIKASLGTAVADQPYFNLCDAIILPATCDGKKKLGELLNNYKTVWMLDLPQSKERTISKKYWLSEIRILKKRLEDLTGKKIKRKNLKNVIKLLHQRYDVVRDLMEIRKSEFPVILGSDFFIVSQAAFFDDISRWIDMTKQLIEELNENIKNKKTVKPRESVRLLLSGAPIIIPNFKIPLMIEMFDAFITIDETCAGSQFMYDSVEVDEYNMLEMIDAISERYLMPSVCPCFIKAEDRIDKILDMIQEYKIDGVIYHTLRLCLLFDVESIKIRDTMEERGMPFLYLNTDYSKEDIGQLRTRIEAYVEILQSRK